MSRIERVLPRVIGIVGALAWLAGCAMPPSAPPITRGEGGQAVRRLDRVRLAGRDFLLPGQRESTAPEPYALYSYLLFGSAPTEATRPRYLAAIRAYLDMLPAIQHLERDGARRRELNVTYLPVESSVAVAAAQTGDPEAPALLLRHYNYAAARILLARVPGGPHLDGPYLVSYARPLSDVERLAGEYGWVDVSSAPAERAGLWVRIFLRETAQREYWVPGTTTRVYTTILDELHKAGEAAPDILKGMVFWLPGR